MTQADAIQITWPQALLVLASLACCISCLWMVFFFGRRIQTSAYLRESLVSASKAEELRGILRELDDRRKSGPLDPTFPPPDGFDREARLLWRDDALRKAGRSEPYYSSSTSPEQRERELAEFAADQKREADRLAPFRRWAEEERLRYAELRRKGEADAQARAERRVPASIDISLLGGGWSFLLEFSTVIVIIFILLCLGILNSITGKDLTTILASIAGYVLGKASSVAHKSQKKDPV